MRKVLYLSIFYWLNLILVLFWQPEKASACVFNYSTFQTVCNIANDDLGPGMTITNACSFTVNSGTLNFGNYDPIQANSSSALQNSAVTIQAQCMKSNTNAVWIGLKSTNNASTAGLGTLSVSGNNLPYTMYQNSGFTIVWGNLQTNGLSPAVDGTVHTYPIYAQIPSGQNLPAGTYQDTITVTVHY
jgi:spore coat protein U-like protein